MKQIIIGGFAMFMLLGTMIACFHIRDVTIESARARHEVRVMSRLQE